MYKKLLTSFFILLILSSAGIASPDTLTLEQAYKLAKNNFPLLKKKMHYEKSLQLKLRNLDTRRLPDLKTIGSATYQSDVVSFPFSIPGTEPLDLPHERFQLYLDVNQIIYDGGFTVSQKHLVEQESRINNQQLEVDLQKLKEQVLNIYFSIRIFKMSEEILKNSKDLLLQKQQILNSSYKGGIINEAAVLKLDAEILQLDQRIEETSAQLVIYLETLSILTGSEISPTTQFISADIDIPASNPINRPELELLSEKQELQAGLMKLEDIKFRPKISAFGQAGLGYPNPFNLFDNSFSPYYLVGARLSWNFWSWGNKKREKEILHINSELMEAEKENLEQSFHIQLQNYLKKKEELELKVNRDTELVDARERIRNITSTQLDAGIIGSGEYIEAVHQEEEARLKLEMHKIQLILAKANYLNQQGNLFNN